MSKKIGTPFENEIADLFEKRGFQSKRMPESDGRHYDLPSGVDILVRGSEGEEIHVQCARRKNIANYLTDKSEEADVLVIRENYGKPIFILTEESFFSMISERDTDERRIKTLDRAIENLINLRELYAE